MAVILGERIAVDMDEVMADFLSKHLALYNADFGESVTADDLRGKTLRELVVEERRARLETFLSARHFARFRGEGLLFTAPHNVGENRYRRVNDWQDVREMFL